MPFSIIRQDITNMGVDAIVNAANTELKQGGGVCGAIFKKAGEKEMVQACAKLAPIQTGGGAITPGYSLPAKYVIHAAGPVYDRNHPEQSRDLLYAAYANALALAKKKRLSSLAFPLISSGTYGYPKDKALQVARTAILDFLKDNDMDVYLAVFDKAAFQTSQALLGQVESYIDQHYVDEHFISRNRAPSKCMAGMQAPQMFSFQLEKPFSEALLECIDEKGKTDVEVYKKANIDRKLFSKIRKGKGYTPRKATILALCLALELSLEETDTLLERAGYALSHASKFDVIVEFCILQGIYDIYAVNELLFQYDQPLLGA